MTQNIPDEEFVTITHNPMYAVSNYGRVFSLFRGIYLAFDLSHDKKYYRVKINGKHFKVSRLVAEHFLDSWNPDLEVDHIDRDTTNNCVWNLRMVTHQQNMWNRGKRINNTTSKYKGVVRAGQYKSKYCAECCFDGVVYRSQVFDTETEAALAYNILAKQLHGEYACLNVFSDNDE